MIFMTTYKVRPYLSKDETKELMEVFATAGAAPGTIAHYVSADASHGVVISESDDPGEGYRSILNYTQWIEYETNVMLTIEQAVPIILDALA
jgi:hypothetical protein